MVELLYRLMLDTSTLDYIYDNDLSAYLNYFIHNRYVSIFVTHVQLAEVNGIKAITANAIIRKYGIVKTILSIGVNIIPVSLTQLSKPVTSESRRIPGYQGPHIGDPERKKNQKNR